MPTKLVYAQGQYGSAKWIRHKVLGKENVWEVGVNGSLRALCVNRRTLAFERDGIPSEDIEQKSDMFQPMLKSL